MAAHLIANSVLIAPIFLCNPNNCIKMYKSEAMLSPRVPWILIKVAVLLDQEGAGNFIEITNTMSIKYLKRIIGFSSFDEEGKHISVRACHRPPE